MRHAASRRGRAVVTTNLPEPAAMAPRVGHVNLVDSDIRADPARFGMPDQPRAFESACALEVGVDRWRIEVAHVFLRDGANEVAVVAGGSDEDVARLMPSGLAAPRIEGRAL